jgi:hypothetical protein
VDDSVLDERIREADRRRRELLERDERFAVQVADARRDLAALEAEARAWGIDPDDLDGEWERAGREAEEELRVDEAARAAWDADLDAAEKVFLDLVG